MALPSKEPDGMEARIARLESDMAHLRSDVGDLRTDVRGLRDRMDAKFDELRNSIASAKTWALLLYIALAGALFGTLARGFGWV